MIAILAVLSHCKLPMAALAQGVKSGYDKSTNFGRYKKYGRGKNYLLTHQNQEDGAHTNLESSISSTENCGPPVLCWFSGNSDFIIIYEAGGLAKDLEPL